MSKMTDSVSRKTKTSTFLIPASITLASSIVMTSAFAFHGNYESSYNVSQEVVKTFTVDADAELSLENINGHVTIESWEGDQIKMEAVIEAYNQKQMDMVEILIDADSDSVDIKTEYQKHWGNDHNHSNAKVTYRLWVPAQTNLSDIELVNGSLDISGVTGIVNASLVNGNVTSDSTASDTDISTVNGKIELTYAENLNQTKRIDLNSVNGSLVINLPSNINADVKAGTVHGSIKNDFDLEVKKKRYSGSRDMKGTIGNGGIRISLDNVNGSIRMNKI